MAGRQLKRKRHRSPNHDPEILVESKLPGSAPVLANREFLQAFEKATQTLKLCPNRVWAVAKEALPDLIPDTLSTPFTENDADNQSHELCTVDFCEFSQRDFTGVKQRHECKQKSCSPLQYLFSRYLLKNAVKSGGSTAWRLDGKSILDPGHPYMAISHVWSDGTGVGGWQDGEVNECLFDFFGDIARQFQCDGLWWDTICIPKEKAARSVALRKIQSDYQDARVTLVHDVFLRNCEWDERTACFAILMSPWFSRGWTAVELAMSRKVKVIFKGPYGSLIKDLDEEILAKDHDTDSPRKRASEIIKNLRQGRTTLNGLLKVLGPRHTSWPKDMALISGLLVGITPMELQQDTYTSILRKIRMLSRGHLFHNLATLPTMNWCPSNLLSMPVASDDISLRFEGSCDLVGSWKIVAVDHRLESLCVWNGAHPLTQRFALSALRCPEECTLLVEPDVEQRCRGLLTREIKDRGRLRGHQYVAALYFHQDMLEAYMNSLDEHQKVAAEVRLLGDISSCYKPSNKSMKEEPSQKLNLHSAIWKGEHEEARRMIREGADRELCDSFGRSPLHLAAERGDGTIVTALLNATHTLDKSIVDGRSRTGETALHRAAWGGSVAVFKSLLPQIDPNTADQYGQTAVHIAAEEGFGPLVELLLDTKRVEVDSRGRNNMTVLHCAALHGHQKIVEMLIHRNAKVMAKDKLGWTPLHFAAMRGYDEIVDIFIKNNADVNATEAGVGWAPLHLAALCGSKNAVDTLLENGARIDATDKVGWMAVHFAEQLEHESAAKLLRVTNDISADGMKHEPGWTMFHLAALNGSRSLIDHMFVLGATSLDGLKRAISWMDTTSATKMAAQSGYHTTVALLLNRLSKRYNHIPIYESILPSLAETAPHAVMRSLLLEGVRVDTEDDSSRTPLLRAAEGGNAAAIKLLLDKGANIEAKNKNNETPLILASRLGDCAVVQLLLDYDADINTFDARYRTSLLWASCNGHDLVVRLLLKHRNVKPNLTFLSPTTPLMEAMQNGHVMVALSLLNSSKVNPSIPGAQGLLPVSYATERGFSEIVKALLKDDRVMLDETFQGRTPLTRASENGHDQIVRLLLNTGRVEPDAKATGTWNGWTPLLFAANKGHAEVVRLLLETGKVDIEANAMRAWTPLLSAAVNGHTGVVRLLLETGKVDIEAKSEEGLTPLDYATVRQHVTTIEILIEHGARRDASSLRSSAYAKFYSKLPVPTYNTTRHHGSTSSSPDAGSPSPRTSPL